MGAVANVTTALFSMLNFRFCAVYILWRLKERSNRRKCIVQHYYVLEKRRFQQVFFEMKACEWTVLVWLATAVSQVFGNTGKSVNLVRLTRLMFYFRAWWLLWLRSEDLESVQFHLYLLECSVVEICRALIEIGDGLQCRGVN